MFGIGWTEMVLVGVIALLVLGPDKLPDAARTMGRWLRELRAASATLRAEFQDGIGDAAAAPPRAGPSGSAASRERGRENAPAERLAPPVDGFGRPVRGLPDPTEAAAPAADEPANGASGGDA